MKKYTLFHIPPLSFYSTSLYRDVAFNWKGIGFGYLFLLLALCWLLLVINIDQHTGQFFDDEAPFVISQIPTITIENGQASIEELQPYFIYDPETAEEMAVIDTTGNINSLEGINAPVLLTRTQLIFKKNEFETRSFELSEIGDYVLDQETLYHWSNFIKSYLSVIIYPFALISSFIFRVIQVLIYAAIGMLFVLICKTQLEYSQLLRLSVVAVTPCIIINTVLWLSSVNLPMSGLIYFMLTMLYLFVGVKTVAAEMNTVEEFN